MHDWIKRSWVHITLKHIQSRQLLPTNKPDIPVQLLPKTNPDKRMQLHTHHVLSPEMQLQ